MTKVIEVISDTNIGGAGKILLAFLKNYDRSSFNIEVVLPKGSQLQAEIEKLAVSCTPIEGMFDKSFSRADTKKLYALFCEKKPDVVHTHASFSARVAARKYGGCKIVATRHSVFDQPAYKKRFPVKNLLGFLNNHYSDCIIAVSPAAGENLIETGTRPEKITTVFNGIDQQRTLSPEEKALVRREYGCKPDDFVCAIIARLERVKGHEYVLQAAKQLLVESPDVKVIIAGIGSIEKELREKAEGLTNVVFAGFVSDIYKIENIMDVQLNASYGTEATSLSLLEGMSLGVPAIVSDFGGNPYVIETGRNGLVVEKKNTTALKDAIIELKRNTAQYEQMKKEAQAIFQKKFTSAVMAEKTQDIYRACIQMK